jgi:hypothetical protein
MYFANTLIYDFFSVTLKVHITFSRVEHVIQGKLSPYYQAMVNIIFVLE